MNRKIRFRFSPQKALAAIHWMVSERPGIDLHTLLKACYFADKEHLNMYRRPVFGATYRAMKFGPVPLEIYEMAKGEALWLAELGIERYPWRMIGYSLALSDNEHPDLDNLSKSDKEELEKAFRKSCEMSFNERTSATHGPDWQAAQLGYIQYEDMIAESPEKEEIVEYLRYHAQHMRI